MADLTEDQVNNEINAAMNGDNDESDSDDDVMAGMETAMGGEAPALPTNDNNNTTNIISEDLIPEAEFAINSNNDQNLLSNNDQNNTINTMDSLDDESTMSPASPETINSNEINNLRNEINNSGNNNGPELQISSINDNNKNNNLNQNDNLRGSVMFNVEAVPMDATGTDIHGPIPNLIVELRFDLRLCYNGIEVDDGIAGPMIGLRPIVEQRLGHDLLELVAEILNGEQKILLLQNDYNLADQQFYNAAKWGSIGMLILFVLFGIYAIIHLANATWQIEILVIMLGVVILIAFGLLGYMLWRRTDSKKKEEEWRQAVLSEVTSQMKNIWSVASNFSDEDDIDSDNINVVFSLFYPIKSNEYDKLEHEIAESDKMAVLRVSQGELLMLDKHVQNQPIYDTTARGGM